MSVIFSFARRLLPWLGAAPEDSSDSEEPEPVEDDDGVLVDGGEEDAAGAGGNGALMAAEVGSVQEAAQPARPLKAAARAQPTGPPPAEWDSCSGSDGGVDTVVLPPSVRSTFATDHRAPVRFTRAVEE